MDATENVTSENIPQIAQKKSWSLGDIFKQLETTNRYFKCQKLGLNFFVSNLASYLIATGVEVGLTAVSIFQTIFIKNKII